MTCHPGRLQQAISDEAREILYGESIDAMLPQLPRYLQVDRAHLVMLAEAGLIPRARAAKLLTAIMELERSEFSDLRGRRAPRGLYLAYEQYLIERTGPDVGGMLQLGRSRNDLHATVAALHHRGCAAAVVAEQLRLLEVVTDKARTYAHVVMPAYTHGQPAVPITVGHYLAGIGEALARDIDGVQCAAAVLERCPLGAGAVGGTTLPIRPERTAALLGFFHPLANSVDAIASRDAVLRLLASCAVAGTTLSRLSQDLLGWLGDTGFFELPDELVGSSSMMPQKRNPFLLEHVQGRAARPLGALVTACTAMHAQPFSSSIAVSTEATAEVERALESLRTALVLLRLVVSGAVPRPGRMAERAGAGFVQATEIATRLAPHLGFRQAHTIVGRAIRDAVARSSTLADVLSPRLRELGIPAALATASPDDIVLAAEHSGAPGPHSLAQGLDRLAVLFDQERRRLAGQRDAWSRAQTELAAAVQRLCSTRDVETHAR